MISSFDGSSFFNILTVCKPRGVYTGGGGVIFEYRAFVRNSGGGDTGGVYMERGGGLIFRILR